MNPSSVLLLLLCASPSILWSAVLWGGKEGAPAALPSSFLPLLSRGREERGGGRARKRRFPIYRRKWIPKSCLTCVSKLSLSWPSFFPGGGGKRKWRQGGTANLFFPVNVRPSPTLVASCCVGKRGGKEKRRCPVSTFLGNWCACVLPKNYPHCEKKGCVLLPSVWGGMWWTHWREFNFERRDLAQRKISSDLNSFPDTKTCHHRHPFSFCERRITSAEKKSFFSNFACVLTTVSVVVDIGDEIEEEEDDDIKKSPFQPQSVRKQLTHSRILLRSRKEAKRREVFLLRRRAIGVFSAKVFLRQTERKGIFRFITKGEGEREGECLKRKGSIFDAFPREEETFVFLRSRIWEESVHNFPKWNAL